MGLNTYAGSFTDHPYSWVVLSVARTRCISIPWELVRHVHSQALSSCAESVIERSFSGLF